MHVDYSTKILSRVIQGYRWNHKILKKFEMGYMWICLTDICPMNSMSQRNIQKCYNHWIV